MQVNLDDEQMKTVVSGLVYLSIFSADCFDRARQLARDLDQEEVYLRYRRQVQEEIKGARPRPLT